MQTFAEALGAKMPNVALAIFGGWVLASMIAGALFVTVRSWLDRSQRRPTSQEAQVHARTRSRRRTRDLTVGPDEKRRHARR